MASKIQHRRDTAAQWELLNPVLADGELGLETDTKRFKIGDGVTQWNDLIFSSMILKDDPETFLKFESVVNMSYNSDGVLLSMTYSNGSVRTFNYSAGMLSTEVITDVDGITVVLTITYTYDVNGNLISINKEV